MSIDNALHSQRHSPQGHIDNVADAILALINASPRTPSKAEIAAVLADYLASHAVVGKPSGLAHEFAVADAEFKQAWEGHCNEEDNPEIRARDDHLHALAKKIVALEPADLPALATVVKWWGDDEWDGGVGERAALRLAELMANGAPTKAPSEFARFWAVHGTGDWDVDNETGYLFARDFLKSVRIRQNVPLCFIVAGMIERGQYTGIEAAFMAVIEKAATQGSGELGWLDRLIRLAGHDPEARPGYAFISEQTDAHEQGSN